MFEGLDNTKMYGFKELKKHTFQDIFRCTNKQAVSLKKPINYINYSNEKQDILSKGSKNTAYDDYYRYCMNYEPDKPPAFDPVAHAKLTSKRFKFSLDRKP